MNALTALNLPETDSSDIEVLRVEANLGAEIREQTRQRIARDEAREVENADSVERTGCARRVVTLFQHGGLGWLGSDAGEKGLGTTDEHG